MPAIQEKIIRPVDEKHGKLILSLRESHFPRYPGRGNS
jgi:hypothetical protein